MRQLVKALQLLYQAPSAEAVVETLSTETADQEAVRMLAAQLAEQVPALSELRSSAVNCDDASQASEELAVDEASLQLSDWGEDEGPDIGSDCEVSGSEDENERRAEAQANLNAGLSSLFETPLSALHCFSSMRMPRAEKPAPKPRDDVTTHVENGMAEAKRRASMGASPEHRAAKAAKLLEAVRRSPVDTAGQTATAAKPRGDPRPENALQPVETVSLLDDEEEVEASPEPEVPATTLPAASSEATQRTRLRRKRPLEPGSLLEALSNAVGKAAVQTIGSEALLLDNLDD